MRDRRANYRGECRTLWLRTERGATALGTAAVVFHIPEHNAAARSHACALWHSRTLPRLLTFACLFTRLPADAPHALADLRTYASFSKTPARRVIHDR